MTRIKAVFWGLCLGLAALWIQADPVVFASGKQPFSKTSISYVMFTGILAMGVMGVSLVLALRSVAVEPYVGGLDKSYRLHKWLGVTALLAVLAHWLLIKAPSWLVSLGIMAPPPRGARRPPQTGGLMHTLQGPAKSIGEWCFYAAVILIVLALVKWFPYRYFLKTHRLLAIVFLILIFHSVVLLKTTYWSKPVAYVATALMAVGAAASLYILFRKVGRTRQAVGEVDAITPHQDGRILGVDVCLKDRWAGHQAGQFAFVNFEDGEGPHPFTISNSWKQDGRLVFLIKGLGDYTTTLPTRLKVGSLVTVEGPYGKFNFSGSHQRQIWVSAGIGITPFISRLQELAMHPDGKRVDLFHATGARDVEPIERLRGLAEAANVQLHVWVAAEDGRLTAAHIRSEVPDWKNADVWFCGPVEFGRDLRRDFFANGLPTGAFHQELFHLR